MEKIINNSGQILTESNMRGIVTNCDYHNVEFPVTVRSFSHGNDEEAENLVSVYDDEILVFNYDLNADVAF